MKEANDSSAKNNVTKDQINKKSEIKKKPKINKSQAPESIYYNIETEKRAQKNLRTYKEEYYNVDLKPKDQMKNHSIYQLDGPAESQYASLEATRNFEHVYDGFKI